MGNESTSAGPAIQVTGLVKSYGQAPILRNMDLEVGWGQRLVLFGGNGSGKTTLIKLLASLSRPDSGSIRIAGWDSQRQGSTLRRFIGVVTHQALLYDELTGMENLRFYGRMFRVPDLEERIQTVAAQMSVERYLSARVGTLSHGTQKRLSLARALLHNPSVLLLDEPETGLDEEALESLDTVLTSPGDSTRTVVMTTHNMDRGLALGDQVGILAGGRIVFHESRSALDVAGFRDTFLRHLEARQ